MCHLFVQLGSPLSIIYETYALNANTRWIVIWKLVILSIKTLHIITIKTLHILDNAPLDPNNENITYPIY